MANFRSYSANQIIQDALRDISELRPGQATSIDVNNELLNKLNDLVDLWQLDGRKIWAIRPDQYTLTEGIQFYLIGPNAPPNPIINGVQYGGFNTIRPTAIVEANIVLSTTTPPTRMPMAIWTPDEWSTIRVQQIPNAIPQGVWYDKNFSATNQLGAGIPAGLGTLSLWPGPLAAYQLELFTPQNIAQVLAFVDLTTVYVFPPGYTEALELSFAERIGPRMALYLKIPRAEWWPFYQEIKRMAARARWTIDTANFKPVYQGVDGAFLQDAAGAWNYLTGES